MITHQIVSRISPYHPIPIQYRDMTVQTVACAGLDLPATFSTDLINTWQRPIYALHKPSTLTLPFVLHAHAHAHPMLMLMLTFALLSTC